MNDNNENSSTLILPISNTIKPKFGAKNTTSYSRTSLIAASTESVISCPMCKGSHYIGKCAMFLKFICHTTSSEDTVTSHVHQLDEHDSYFIEMYVQIFLS